MAAWSALNAEQLVEYFSEDGIYHNMPAQPVQGHEKLKVFIEGFIGPWTKTTWDILNIIGDGDLVVVERIDLVAAYVKCATGRSRCGAIILI